MSPIFVCRAHYYLSASNRIGGTIPSTIGMLTNLEEIFLGKLLGLAFYLLVLRRAEKLLML